MPAEPREYYVAPSVFAKKRGPNLPPPRSGSLINSLEASIQSLLGEVAEGGWGMHTQVGAGGARATKKHLSDEGEPRFSARPPPQQTLLKLLWFDTNQLRLVAALFWRRLMEAHCCYMCSAAAGLDVSKVAQMPRLPKCRVYGSFCAVNGDDV